MKILFDNAATRATIISTNEDANYPPENLVHQFLELRWQEVTCTKITITFDDPEDINCVFYGFTNLVGMWAVTNTGAIATNAKTGGFELTSDYDYLVTEDGYRIALTESAENGDAVYFDSLQEDVTVLYLYIWSSESPIYLGGIGTGVAYTMPNPVANYDEDNQDNSSVLESAFGQVLQNYIEPLRDEAYDFRGVLRETKEEIMDLYRSVGIGGKVWVDVTERNHTNKKPFYAQIASSPGSTKDGKYYQFGMRFKEAR